ncbi:MAG: hypothetical protein SH868_05365 [Bythopirellula sp.]|nr:hypothetical protein [Bythopirellula sp.]
MKHDAGPSQNNWSLWNHQLVIERPDFRQINGLALRRFRECRIFYNNRGGMVYAIAQACIFHALFPSQVFTLRKARDGNCFSTHEP